jgi:glycosyltransferase involved in cell wall biosynthesis
MTRLLFLLRSLDPGGSERQLVQLVKGLDKTRFDVTVVTFYDGGALRPELEAISGVQVVSLRKRGRWDVLPFLWRLWRLASKIRPQIMHGYLDMANILSLLIGKSVSARVVWGLRASIVDFSRYDWAAIWGYRTSARLSRFADLIIVNSHMGKQHNIARGFHSRRMVMVHNGIDTERFRPDPGLGGEMRRRWGIAHGELLIGLVARLDPMKDHPTFLRAASVFAGQHEARYVCVGDGADDYKDRMWALADELGLGDRLVWAGAVSEMPAVYNALDIACSSSYGEGFSNSIGEAMACEVPCVVTGVGDSALIVGGTGEVVPPNDPQALAAALARLAKLPCEERAALGRQARERIVSEYSVAQLARKTEAALLRLL